MPQRWIPRSVTLALAVSALAALAGCDQLTGSDAEPGPEPAEITSFTASDNLVDAGANVTLSWQVSGDAPLTLTLDPGGTDVSGRTSTTVTVADVAVNGETRSFSYEVNLQ